MATQQTTIPIPPQGTFSDSSFVANPKNISEGFRTPIDQYGTGIQNVASLVKPSTPLIQESTNKNILSPSDANAFINNAGKNLQTQFPEGGSMKGTTSLNSLNPNSNESERDTILRSMGVPTQTGALGPIDIVKQYQDILNQERERFNKAYKPKEEQTASNLRDQTLASQASAVSGGRAGTTFQTMYMNDLASGQARELEILESEKRNAVNASAGAMQRGLIGEYMEQENRANAIAAKQDQAIKEYQKKQEDIVKAEKDSRALVSETIEGFLKGGNEPNDTQLDYWDKKYNLDSGSSKVLLDAVKYDFSFKNSKDVTEKTTAAVDSAKKISDYLDSRPLGSRVTIGGVEYIGTGKGNMKTGVQIDKATGQGLYYEFNPETGVTTTTPMGTVGFNDPNWQIEKDNAGNLWRVNVDTREMEQLSVPGAGARQVGPQIRIPLTPGSAQKTMNAILPEGTVGPALPGSKYAGQCGAYCNWAYGEGVFGNTIQEKTAALKRFPSVDPKEIQTNNTFVMKSGSTGHVGFVGDLVHDPDTGELTGFMANESNMVPPSGGKLSYSRFVPINDPRIVGFADIPTPNLPQMGSDSVLTSVASGTMPDGFGVFGGKAADKEKDEILSVADAKALKVPFGTTRSQAAKLGITPKAEEKEVQPTEVSTFGRQKDDKYLTAANKLADDFRAESKDFITRKDGYQYVQNFDPKNHTPQDDIELVFSFMKVLDPGSVVREGEFATAQKYTDTLDSLGVSLKKIQKGNLLSDKQVTNILGALQRRYDTAEKNHIKVEEAYKSRAKGYKIDPEDVVTDYKIQKKDSEQPKQNQTQVLNGVTYTWDGSNWVSE